MLRSRPATARLLPAAFLAAGVLVLGACGGDSGSETTIPATGETATRPERPSQQFFDYRLIESQGGVKQWILESEEMQKFTGQRDIILIDVHMDFFQEGEHFSVLTSDSGRANVQTKQVFTWGDVVVLTDDGRRLETEELHFDDKTGLIRNDVFNRFTRGVDVMTGYGLEATPNLEYIELRRDVKASVTDTTSLMDTGPGPESEPQ